MPVSNKLYYRLMVTKHHHRLKRKAVEYKGGTCQKCGYDRSLTALVFHHRDPDQKDFAIAKLKSSNWDKIRSELDKCDLLCSNCHSELHESLANRQLLELENRVRETTPVRCTRSKLNLICKQCGEPFTAYPSNRPKAQFCSKMCKARSQIQVTPQ